MSLLTSAATEEQEEEEKPELPPQYRFLAHNRSVREKIENWRTRVRHHALGDLDQTVAEFYARHITDVSSLHELNRLLRDPAMQECLCITEAELAGGKLLSYDAAAFPDAVPVSGQPVSLAYPNQTPNWTTSRNSTRL